MYIYSVLEMSVSSFKQAYITCTRVFPLTFEQSLSIVFSSIAMLICVVH